MATRSALVSALLLATAISACGGDLFGPGGRSLQIVPDSVTVLLGDRTTFEVKYEGGGTLDRRSVEWSSYGEAIAAIVGPGEATGIQPGTTAIAAQRESARGIALVTVVGLGLEAVTAGRLHSCGWAEGDTAYCWGYNSHGQLGSDAGDRDCGGAPCHFRPAPVTGDVRFSTLAAGDDHTCGLSTAGRAYCWGRNEEGQLGRGDPSDGSNVEPLPVAGDHTFKGITSGRSHSCAVTQEGRAYCWGDNEEGQLGTGSTSSSPAPAAVATDARFETLSAGALHTCGLTTLGSVHCWGRNNVHQLGNGTRDSATRPVRVSGEQTFVTVSAGDAHTCALAAGAAAYCWGGNHEGQGGVGTRGAIPTPTPVQGNHRFTTIAAGGIHSCGGLQGGGALCWGWNGYRQLGDDSGRRGVLVPTNAETDLEFAMLDAGWLHTCGATSDAEIRCWGYNGAGQLGRPEVTAGCPNEPNQSCSRVPEPILGSP